MNTLCNTRAALLTLALRLWCLMPSQWLRRWRVQK